MTLPNRTLADFCAWWPEGERRPCYGPAGLVLVRLSGQTLCFTCAEHAPAWASRISLSTAYRVVRLKGRMANFDADMLAAMCDVLEVKPGELFEVVPLRGKRG